MIIIHNSETSLIGQPLAALFLTANRALSFLVATGDQILLLILNKTVLFFVMFFHYNFLFFLRQYVIFRKYSVITGILYVITIIFLTNYYSNSFILIYGFNIFIYIVHIYLYLADMFFL